MVLGMLGFGVNDAMVKSLGDTLPLGQIILVRGVVMCVFIALFLWRRDAVQRACPSPNHLRSAFNDVKKPLVLLRASMEMFATLLFLTALFQMALGNVIAILQSLPLAVTAGAALFMSEKVGWRRWLAILIGFAGVLLIVRPGMEGYNASSLLVLGTVLFAAARDLITRGLPDDVTSIGVSFATSIVLALTGCALLLFQNNWVSMTSWDFLVLTAAASFLFMGYQFIVLSMRVGDVSFVAPFRYTGLLWAVLLGYWWFGEIPDRYTLLGSLIVVSMGLFTLYRETKQQ